MGFLRKLKGLRTVLFNGVLALLALATQVTEVPGLGHILGPENAMKAVAAVAILNIVLRAVTTTPLGKRGEDA